MTRSTIDTLRDLNPVTDDEAQAITRTKDLAWLDVQFKAQSIVQEMPAKRRRRPVVRRLVPALVAAGLIGGIALTVVDHSGSDRTQALGPALAFSDEGRYLKIKIVDLEADSARFNKELQERQLKFHIELAPASPSLAGKLLTIGDFGENGDGGEFKVSETPFNCVIGGAAPCNIELKVPKEFQGEGLVIIGRPARPGERVEYPGWLWEPGELLAGLKVEGQPVGQVRALVAQRGYTVGKYVRTASLDEPGIPPVEVPDNWVVVEASLLVDKQVILRVRPKLR